MANAVLFVYGTLQDGDVLAAILGRPVDTATLQRASAPGFRAVTYPDRVYPALVAVAGATAPGMLVESLSQLDLMVLDAFEGDEYRRETIAVLVDGYDREAFVYLPVISIGNGLDWSLDIWIRQHKPVVVGSETITARAIRDRLSKQRQ